MSLVFLLLLPVLIFLISWKVFEWFEWSRSKSFHSSRWEYYKAKFWFALGNTILFSVLAYIFAGAWFAPNDKPVTPALENTKPVQSVDEATPKRLSVPIESPAARTYSSEEISQMEDRVNYHGDDPVVRARLGLPPRSVEQ